jgi:S-adenosylmethionine decarboxylase
MQDAGTHLIVDGYVKDAAVFNAVTLDKLFRDIVSTLDMTILKGPDFVEVPVEEEKLAYAKRTGQFVDEGGITGTCIVSTSHISIHCWPLRKFFSLDTFSCKSFDDIKALDVILTSLHVDRYNSTVLSRRKPAGGD